METKNNVKFESGKEYTLAQLFYDENKVVIPDLQRDYCWGDKAWNKDTNRSSEIVNQFIEQLWQLYDQNNEQPFTLGMIYGYEHPRYHINLCDGQQRLTTLYLLLGMINRVSDNNYFQAYLISDYELHQDDQEPYLQYAIRESSLYFLSDLVVNFFLKKDIALENIKEQSWYFSEYESDATITSMVSALGIIENFLKEKKLEKTLEFGEYLTNKIQFLYYDMGSRLQGEETFVIINTTGEPLSASENIKPLLLGHIEDETQRKEYSQEWEDREEWFWHHRGSNEQTADAAYLNFFEWFCNIVLKQETYEEKTLDPKNFLGKNCEEYSRPEKLDLIHRYFCALQSLLKVCEKDTDIQGVLKSIKNEAIDLNWFRQKRPDKKDIVLPLICYLQKFPQPRLFHRFVRRVRKNWFDKTRKYRNNSFLDWRYLVALIEKCSKEEEVFSFDTTRLEKIPNVNCPQWHDDNEQFTELILDNEDLKKKLHDEWEKHEGYKDLMDDFTVLRKAIGEEQSSEKIEKVFERFLNLFDCMYDSEFSRKNQELSNFYRLFKVYIECPGASRVERTSGITGAWFSWVDRNDDSYFNYLKDENFIELLKSEDPIEYIKSYIRKITTEEQVFFDEKNYTPETHLKSWLLMKVLCSQGKLLSFHDGKGCGIDSTGNGLAVYDNMNENKIDRKLPMSLANSICGFAVKAPGNYVCYATDFWNNQQCLDTMFVFPSSDGITLEEFQNIRAGKSSLCEEYIKRVECELHKIFQEFKKEG